MLLRPPQFPANKREELMAELRTLLDEQIKESLDELGYPSDISHYEVGTINIFCRYSELFNIMLSIEMCRICPSGY